MSNTPLILSDNYFDNVVLHTGFGVANASSDDAANREAFRAADNLRDVTSWTPGGTNSQRSLYVDTLASNAANIIVLDRGHNLNGVTITYGSYSDTGLSTGAATATATIPTTPGGLPTDANGCLTVDGVWWKTFSIAANRVWALTIPALGANIAPIVTGLYLGTSYRLPTVLDAPGAYDYHRQIRYERNVLTTGGVRVKSRPRRYDRLKLKFSLEGTDYAAFDPHMVRLLDYGHPWWFCLDDSDATQAGLMRLFQPPMDTDFEPQSNPYHREIALELEEVIPSLKL